MWPPLWFARRLRGHGFPLLPATRGWRKPPEPSAWRSSRSGRENFPRVDEGIAHQPMVLGEGTPLGEESPRVDRHGGEGGGEVRPGGKGARVHGASQDENGDRGEKREGRGRRGLRLETAESIQDGAALRLGIGGDFFLHELAGADEVEDDHRLRKEGEENSRDRKTDVPGDEMAGGRRGGMEGRGEDEALRGGREKARERQQRRQEQRDRHRGDYARSVLRRRVRPLNPTRLRRERKKVPHPGPSPAGRERRVPRALPREAHESSS